MKCKVYSGRECKIPNPPTILCLECCIYFQERALDNLFVPGDPSLVGRRILDLGLSNRLILASFLSLLDEIPEQKKILEDFKKKEDKGKLVV